MTEIVAVPHHLPARREIDLVQFAEQASSARRIAQVLCETSFVPDAYRRKPDEATAAIMFGREVDIPPMHALQEIVVIQGRPTLSANAMRGVAQDHGIVFELLEASDVKVVMRARAPQQEKWTTSEWTTGRAQRMGLTNKDNWRKQPQAMMQARCTSELCRLVAANHLMGLHYSSEELTDMNDDTPAPVTVEAKKTTVRRKTTPPVYEAPELEEQQPDPISTGTRRALMAAFADAGITDRVVRLKAISGAIERDVTSANQLTEVEARHVITELNEERRRDVSDGSGDDWPPTVEATP